MKRGLRKEKENRMKRGTEGENKERKQRIEEKKRW